MPEEIRTFEGGMDLDLDERLLPSNTYRYSLNIRNSNSERGSIGTISMLEGNQAPATTISLNGYNQCVGAIDDTPNNRMIYVVWNEDGDNLILSYDYDENEVNTVFSDSGNVLDLQYNDRLEVDLARDDNDTYLLFTSGSGEPKNINIDAGIRAYSNTTGSKSIYRGLHTLKGITTAYNGEVYYAKIGFTDNSGAAQEKDFYFRCTATVSTTNDPVEVGVIGVVYNTGATLSPNEGWELCPAGFILPDRINVTNPREENYTAIVKPPSKKSTNLYTTNTDYPFNNLIGAWWQFKYKYITSDGRESSWSEISDAPPPLYKPDSLLESSDYETLLNNNQIDIYLDVPDVMKYKSIKVAVRKITSDRSPDDWYLIDDIDVLDQTKYVYTDDLKIRIPFTNGEVLMPVDPREAEQLFSWIPRDVQAQAITTKNRIVYANFTEGRDFYLDGVNSIRRNPPTVEFYEENNPWVSQGDPCDYEIYSASATAATSYTLERESSAIAERYFSNIVSGGNDEVVAMNFSNITIGVPITLKLYAVNQIDVFNVGQANKSNSHSFEYTYMPSSTAASAAVQAFTNAINNSQAFYDVTFDQTTYTANTYDYYGVLASSGTSTAGTGVALLDYLYILPQKHPDYPTTDTYTTIYSMIEVKSKNYTSQRTFKRGSLQKFGIVYEDNFGRQTSVITHPNLEMENRWWKDDTVTSVTSGIAGNIYNDIGYRFALATLRHDAPSWAKRYHIVKSLDNGVDDFVQLPLTKNEDLPDATTAITNPFNGKYFFRGYVADPTEEMTTSNSTAASLGGQEFIYLTLNALQGNPEAYNRINDADINWQYEKGDRIRFCYNVQTSVTPPEPNGSAAYATGDLDFEIVKYIEDYNAVALRVTDFPDLWVTATASGTSPFKGVFDSNNQTGTAETGGEGIKALVFEIYRPSVTRTDNFYYELYSGSISADTANSRYYHLANGLDDEQNQTSAQSAILRLDGDVYLKPRTYPIYSNPTTNTAISTTANTRYITFFIEEANLFDKSSSKTWGIGRPNRIVRSTNSPDDYAGKGGGVILRNTIRYSEPFAPDQGKNGFGTIYDLNFKDTNNVMKPITKLHTEGDNLILLHEEAVGYMRSDREVIETVDGGGLTVQSDTPLSDPVYYNSNNGTIHRESFAFSGGRKYYYDNNTSSVIRLSQDGVTVISDKGVSKWIAQVSREIEQAEKSKVVGVYDPRFDEYVLSFYRTFEETDNATNFDAVDYRADVTISDIATYDVNTGDYIFVNVRLSSVFFEEIYRNVWVKVHDIVGTTVTLEFDVTSYNALVSDTFLTMHFPKIDVLTYSERLGKWTSFASYKPDWFVNSGVNICSFRQGYVFIHNDFDNPCEFYNIDNDAYVDVVSNQNPTVVKQWLSLALTSNQTWGSAATFTPDIEVPTGTTLSGTDFSMDAGVITSADQRTTTDEMVYKEQQLFAPYLRATDSASASYFEGDKPKGFWQKTRIKFNGGGTDIRKVFSVMFKYVVSQFTR